jgi:hypothetical protein
MPIAASYPLGAQATVSAIKWDVRGAVVNAAPTRVFEIGENPNPRTTPFTVVGGGVSPTPGLRVGGSFGTGDYAAPEELTGASTTARRVTQAAIEAEYAFAYTKVSAEFVRDRFDTAIAPALAYEWFVQGAQTITPRWFGAGRVEGTSAPGLTTASGTGPRKQFRVLEGTLGFRLTSDFTLRASIVGRKAFTRTTWDRQAGASLVWARRWW